MKLTIILPAIGKEEGKKYMRTWKLEPLIAPILSALTPPEVDREFFDDRIELINYDTATDLVAISIETYNARRGYKIAEKFRERGVPVVIGGIHATLMPEEAINFADSVVIGNADGVWLDVIKDAKSNKLKKFYYGTKYASKVEPDREILSGKRYLPIKLVETGKGCIFKCKFCTTASLYTGGYHVRAIDKIIEDIVYTNSRYILFADENIASNLKWFKTLLRELKGCNIRWFGQGSLTMARDPEFLKLIYDSGGRLILVGFESLNPRSLKVMNKQWITKIGNLDELVKRIHDAGINIYASFIFGLADDDEETFKYTLEFALKHSFFYAAFNHFQPYPGTPIYNDLLQSGRLLSPKWWLEEYRYGEVNFVPKKITPEQLYILCQSIRKEYFRYSNVLKRLKETVKRNHELEFIANYILLNVNQYYEIERRNSIRLASYLDELPK